jgi:hypothetical protein
VTTATLSRSASVASIHLAGINASRKKSGLAPLALVEAEREFADVNRSPSRTKSATRRTFSNAGAAGSMWSGIIAKLNATLPSRAPSAACTSPASVAAEGRTDAVVDWSSIASALNREAGLATPARSRAR